MIPQGLHVAATCEVWLHPNRRVLAVGVVLAAMGLLASVAVAVWSTSAWLRWGSVAGSLVMSYLLALSVYLLRQPRLAYQPGTLLVYLKTGGPIGVPIDVVECFFLGQGPALLPNVFDPRGGDEETATIVVRLAEAAQEWRHFDVRPALGQWCEGYITIRGTWCEPISGPLVKRLNERLVAAHRLMREQKQRETK